MAMARDYQGVMPGEPESNDELQSIETGNPSSAQDRMASGDEVTSDVDANREQAKVVGDEAVGGLAPTPGQNLTESNAAAVGIEIPDRTPLGVQEMLDRRDDHRWELDPESSDDYTEHS
jgi:hypothetical protein